MKTKRKKTYTFYSHDFLPPLMDAKTRILVVGSFSSSINRNKHGYYNQKGNYMLPLLGSVCELNNQSFEDKDFLEYGIGFYDIVQNCYAPGSFADSDILDPVVDRNLFRIINEKTIEAVVVTGKLAWTLFCENARLIKDNKIIVRIPSTSNTNNHYRKPDWESVVTLLKKIIMLGANE